MRLSKIAMALTALLFFVFCSRVALADPSGRVLVVDLTGDVDDANALRAAIASELKATVVTPDDPKATSAGGTLTIEVRGGDKRIAATYRSLGSPVTRTVDLPEDPKRARTVAVLLAGNVAREEADDLLDKLRKPGPTATPAGNAEDAERDVRRLHAVLDDLGEHRHDLRKWVGIASLIEGGLSAGAGAYYVFRDTSTQHTERAGVFLLMHGAASTAVGTVLLLSSKGATYERLANELAQGEGKIAPEDLVRKVEFKWAEMANDARSERKVLGVVGIGLGVLTAGAGLALPALVPDSQEGRGLPWLTWGFVALGGLNAAAGINLLIDETEIERSWHIYRRMKDFDAAPPPAPGLQPKVGFAPLPGGGGMASLGFSF